MALFKTILAQNICRNAFTVSVRTFWEPHRRGDRKYLIEDKRTNIEKVKDGLHMLKDEFKLMSEEMQEKFTGDPKFYLPGDTEIIWAFNSQEHLNKWIVTADKDNRDGFSHCSLELSKNKKGLFHGYLDNTKPQDGETHRTGYCNITAVKAKKAFKNLAYLDWTMFTHLVMRVRGDGRAYMINISTAGYFDLSWHNMFSFVLYTRGGPYWQDVKIPFSKFLFSSKGRVQDKQKPIPLNTIINLGITCGDKSTGPFQLELDYIGVHFDANHKEEFAYELYQTPKFQIY